MLAVAPMDAGRPWGLLPAESSMMDTARAWIPPASPTALAAERQTASPMAQSLPGGSRGSLAVRRRQSLAPHRRNGSSVTRGSGNWKARGGSGGGGGGGGGGAMVQGASPTEGGGRPGGGRRARASAGVDSGNGDSHPRSQERASRDDEGGSRGDRTNGGQRGSNSSGGGARGMAGCGEAWGVAATVTTSRTSSDRMHSGGSGFGRGGKSSNGPEVWAWAGTSGGGAARGVAMLNAYGLQNDKHNPTCPRGTPGESAARHGRWQRNQDGAGPRKVEGGGGGAGDEGGGDKCRGLECGGGTGQRRSGARGTGSGRTGDKASDRVSAGQGHRFRGGKGRKHRSSAFPQDKSRVIRERCPSEDKGTSGGQILGDAAAEGCDVVGRSAGQASASAASSSGSHHEGEGVLVRPGSRELALQDPLVLPRGSTGSPHPSGCSALPTTTTTTSGHTAAATTLSMDGRGGSAAPPYRPSLSAAVSTSYPPVLPDLVAAIGTGATGGVGAMIAAFEADSGCGDALGEGGGGGGGGDDHSTPPVSRQRSHSHHSPWQARKHPRGGFPGGRVGRHHHASHQGQPRERSRVEERPGSGSTTGRIGSCFSSESAEMVDSASSACGAGVWVAGAPPATTFPNAKKSVDDGSSPPPTSDPREPHVRPTSSGNAAPSSRSVAAVVQAEDLSEHLGVFGAAGGRRGGGDLDPFDRLLHPHHHHGGHGSSSAVPQSELIDHFKLATRPTSRRGTRKPGSGEGGEGAGGECTPEPAFCLFSRGVGGGGSARD